MSEKTFRLYRALNPKGELKVVMIPCRSLVVVISLVIAITSSAVSAEDPQRGRLSDGRAFRTDDQGNQLVDYIAELEVNVESLERQVRGLEDENKEKQTIISRLQRGERAEGTLVEKSLDGSSDVPKVAAQKAPECKPCPSQDQCLKTDCSGEIKKCEELVDDLKVDHQVALTVQKKEISELQERVGSYENELVSLKSELKSEQGQRSQYEERIALLQRERDNSVQEVRKVKSNTSTEREDTRASLRNEPAVNQPAVVVAANSSGLRETRIQAVDMLRSKMLSDLNSLQGLVSYRDQLAQNVRRKGGNVDTFTHSTPEARESIGKFRGQITSASKVHELSAMRGSINELRGSIQSEIATLKRLEKSR